MTISGWIDDVFRLVATPYFPSQGTKWKLRTQRSVSPTSPRSFFDAHALSVVAACPKKTGKALTAKAKPQSVRLRFPAVSSGGPKMIEQNLPQGRYQVVFLIMFNKIIMDGSPF